jgi:hypothetical protein
VFGFVLQPVLLVLLVLTNLFFIRQFYNYLFREGASGTVRKAFILINMYAMVVFILLTINAFVS